MPATGSCRHQRHRDPSIAVLQALGCWLTCWSRSTQTTSRSIDRRRSTPAKVSISTARRAGWVGATSELLAPLVEAIRAHVMSANKLHADDTPVPVLAPGNGKTRIGR